MPPTPRDQRSPHGPHSDRFESADAPPYYAGADDIWRGPGGRPDVHLTMGELAQRWRRTRKTIERHYEEWGLRPLRFGGRLLFPIPQILEAEERAMRGEFAQTKQSL